MKIEQICRYPVKSLNPDILKQAELVPGQGLAGDRAFAIAKPDTDFDETAPEYRRKTEFVILMTHEKLAALDCVYDETAGTLSIHEGGRVVARGDVRKTADREKLGRFLGVRAGIDPRSDGTARLVHAKAHMFSDVAVKCLSLINRESVEALAARMGRALDPVRFRGNIVFSGLPAWEELDWEPGHEFSIGEARLRVLEPIARCPATDVNPETARRDSNIPGTLVREFGHPNMGIYAEVSGGGKIARGDPISLGG